MFDIDREHQFLSDYIKYRIDMSKLQNTAMIRNFVELQFYTA